MLLDRATANEFVHEHVALLPDPEGAVGRLVFDGGVPPAVEMHDMRGGGQIEPAPPALSDSTKNGTRLVFLKLLHEIFAFADRGLAMQDQAAARRTRRRAIAPTAR